MAQSARLLSVASSLNFRVKKRIINIETLVSARAKGPQLEKYRILISALSPALTNIKDLVKNERVLIIFVRRYENSFYTRYLITNTISRINSALIESASRFYARLIKDRKKAA